MSAIEKIAAKLANYPGVQFTRTQTSIAVAPANTDGFEVRLEQHQGGFTVWFDGWHEELSPRSPL